MKPAIQSETIKEVLACHYDELEHSIWHIKNSYDKVSKDLPRKYRQVIIERIKNYLDAIHTTKHYCILVESLIEKEDRFELLRVCKLILQLNEFIKEDAQDLVSFIQNGNFPNYSQKETLH